MVRLMSRPLCPRGKGPGTHWIRSLVGSSSGLDGVEKRNIELQPLACRYTGGASMLPHGLTSRPTFFSDGRCTSARGKPRLTGYVAAGAGRRLTVSATGIHTHSVALNA